MGEANEGSHERRRVLLLFGFSILPPLFLLTILAVVAAQNDEAALNYVEQERTRQAAAKVQRALGRALRAAEETVFSDLKAETLRAEDRDSVRDALERVQRTHAFVARAFALDAGGQPVWPSFTMPFLLEGQGFSPPQEAFGTSDADYQRRAELQALYERSLEHQRLGRIEQALAGFRAVAESSESTATRACRSSFRLGECLRTLGRRAEAELAFERAADAALPVRDEQGRPLRVEARLACAEMALDGKAAVAGERAAALGRDLFDGALRQDLRESEWSAALERVRKALGAAGRGADREAVLAREEDVSARLAWLRTLDREVSALLAEASDAPPGEVRTYAGRGRPPTVIAYRVYGGTERLLVGFEVDLDRLAKDVFESVCVAIGLEEEVFLEVFDAEGTARAGGGASLGVSGIEHSGGLRESVVLDPIGWTVRVTRPTLALEQARRNRLLLYAALISLTSLSALAGAFATIRYVQRSLELAKMKSDFLSNITHELKTPLTSIKMYGEMLATGRLRTEEKRKEYAEHIVREGDRLQKLIENVLDFARQESGKHEYVLAEDDLADTVREAIDLFRLSAKARGFDLFVELPPVGKLPPVDLDRDAIVRSVLNLLSNAVKYSTDQRYLKVTVRRERKDMLGVCVEDKGMGIDEGDLEKIFGRFYRAGDELTRGISGAGLGLSLVDHIVRAHNGEIGVESERGRGSAFTILLPVVEDYREQWPPPPVAGGPDDPLAMTVDEDEETADQLGGRLTGE